MGKINYKIIGIKFDINENKNYVFDGYQTNININILIVHI